MWISPTPMHERVASSSQSDFNIRAIACLILLALLCMVPGCKKQPTPEDKLAAAQDKLAAAIAKLPPPPATPAVVPQPTPASELPDWKPASTPGIEIPRVVGLVVDSTIASKHDLENLDRIVDIDATTVTVEVDTEIAPPTPDARPVDLNAPPAATGKGKVRIDVAALASSNHFFPFFHPDKVDHYPGTTAREVSSETLNELRAGQTVVWQDAIDPDVWFANVVRKISQPTKLDWGELEVNQCNLQRVEPMDLAGPVLVNNAPVELPALHAKCVLDNGKENHFYILDQPSNPILLYTRMGVSGDRSQAIKISFTAPAKLPEGEMKSGVMPSSGSGNGMEKKLAEKEPVEIYGIYFDFNSAHIKPESEDVLKQISEVMHKNPAWKLSVSGHTDNVGGDDFNLKLSQARSAAVKTALVKEYSIAPDRLTTGGYGASQPIADNTKVEGRARNRRVVLQRQ